MLSKVSVAMLSNVGLEEWFYWKQQAKTLLQFVVLDISLFLKWFDFYRFRICEKCTSFLGKNKNKNKQTNMSSLISALVGSWWSKFSVIYTSSKVLGYGQVDKFVLQGCSTNRPKMLEHRPCCIIYKSHVPSSFIFP